MQGVSLSQQLGQQLKLSPTQIQMMKMLEVPACDLQQRINEELQENPALEEGVEKDSELQGAEDMDYDAEEEYDNPLKNDDFDYDDYIQDDDTADRMAGNYSSDSIDSMDVAMRYMQGEKSLIDYLEEQLSFSNLNEELKPIAKFVIGNIDDYGYLRRTVEELADDYAFREGVQVSDEDVRKVVHAIQGFEPAGIAAKDLQECLILQLRRKPKTPEVELAIRVLKSNFEAFSRHYYDRICARMNITSDSLQGAKGEIARLNPRPGSNWSNGDIGRQSNTIIPDFFVEMRDGELEISLNEGDVSPLRVSQDYNEMLKNFSKSEKKQNTEQKNALRFVKQKIDAARWFIDAIQQRNETLKRTIKAIVEEQKKFFLTGDEIDLKPIRLQRIADMTGYDVSTISRVCNSKYVMTDYGIYSLKFFFSEAMTNAQGEDISNREIKLTMKSLIEAEDPRNPMTDDQLAHAMTKAGYPLARRTVVKYREQMNIPKARLRKKI